MWRLDARALDVSSHLRSRLAVRCCEFELACEVLRSSCVVNVDLALGRYDRLDGEEKLGQELLPGWIDHDL